VQTEIFYGPLVNYDQPFVAPRAISGFETGTLGLGHIVLVVHDLEESLHFYRDVLGMRISDFIQLANPGHAAGSSRRMAFFHCNPRHHSLAFLAAPIKPRLRHFMLQVKALDDVGSTYTLCQDQGIPIARSLGRHTNDHMVSFYMQSPAGFEVEYGWGARTVDDHTWQVQQHTRGSIWGHRNPALPSEPVAAGR
jgi:2,3-dihydroxybiphenyl 1,2-dioxygenase